MKRSSHILKIALFTGAFFLFAFGAAGQNGWLELLPGSDRIEKSANSNRTRLIGHVNFKYQNSVMFCDSAHTDYDTKEIWAYGHVQLNRRDTLNLYCDSLYYNGNTRMAKLWGHVRVRDREYKVTTDTLEYDARNAKAIYRYGGKIENITTDEVLTSRLGYFYPNTEESFFRGNVVYKRPDMKMTTDTLQYNYLLHRVYFYGPTNILTDSTKIYCEKGWYNVQTEDGLLLQHARIDKSPRIIEGDSLYYHSKKKYAEGRGNVIVTDTIQKMQLRGGYFFSDEQNRKDMVTQNPIVRLSKTKDTLWLRADTLFHFRDSTNQTAAINGLHHVKIFQEKIQGIADTMLYSRSSGTLDLWGKPHFWAKNSELTGDSIRAYLLHDSILQKVHIREDAFSAMEIDSGKYYNQLAGNEMWAYFIDNEIVRTDVNGNARTLYYPEDEKKTDTAVIIRRQGMNRMFASDLRVYLDSGEVIGITFFKEPDGIFYPIDQIDPKEQFLKGYAWNPALRPKSWKELLTGESPELIPVEADPEEKKHD